MARIGLAVESAIQSITGQFPVEATVMKMKAATVTAWVVGVGLLGSVAVAQDSDTDRAHAKAFVQDSVITSKIKTKLAAEHITSLGRIHVDTDKDGVVWLTGSARTQAAIDKAGDIARGTEGVRDVKNRLIIKKDD